MELNFNSVETIPNLKASAAFQVDSGKVFKDDVDICPMIIDKKLSYIRSVSGLDGFEEALDHMQRSKAFICVSDSHSASEDGVPRHEASH